MKSNSKLQPIKAFRYYKRGLPHYEDPGNTYFVTFKTSPGLELTDKAKDIVLEAVKYHAHKKYVLISCTVMSTHVHIIIHPLEETDGSYYSLAKIMHSIKSYSAHKINEITHKVGNIWLDENYDRIIRDDEDYISKMNYTIYNPVKAGLADEPRNYKWLYYKENDKV